jgi:hypothetical protein
MDQPDTQPPEKQRTLAGAASEIVLWALIIGAVLYTVAYRGDMPLRWVVTLHGILTVLTAGFVLIHAGKIFETSVAVVILTAIGAFFALPAYHDHKARGAAGEAYLVAKALAEALDRNPSVKSVDRLGVAVPQETVSKVAIEPDGSLRLTLAQAPLSGKELTFAPTVAKGVRAWRCASKHVEWKYLPQACRE